MTSERWALSAGPDGYLLTNAETGETATLAGPRATVALAAMQTLHGAFDRFCERLWALGLPLYAVDGREYDHPDAMMAGHGRHPPFRVFDVRAQDYLPGEYATREEAIAAATEAAAAATSKGASPCL